MLDLTQEKTSNTCFPSTDEIALQEIHDVQVEMHSDRFARSFPAKEDSCRFSRQFGGVGSVWTHEFIEHECKVSSDMPIQYFERM